MSLSIDAKKAIVSEVAEVAAGAPSAIAAEYIGLTVADMTELRKAARDAGIYMKVIRNTLARRAFENTSFECMNDGLVGPLLIAFSNDEPGSAAKVIRNFAKANEKLVVRLIALNGKLLEPSDLERLATLPSLEQARGMLLGVLQAPLTKFVRVIAEPEAKFVRTLAARRDQQQAA